MSQAITKTINLTELLELSLKETLTMMEDGIDISDPSLITPLEATANQYPEISAECNSALMELVKKQMERSSENTSSDSQNEF